MKQSSNISSLCFILTGACNFACEYCYQNRNGSKICQTVIDEAIDKLLVLVEPDGEVSFYGGEPLICIEELRYIVKKISGIRKDIRFCITTNGSLLTSKIVDFLSNHSFNVMISYDGESLQNKRSAGSAKNIKSHLEVLLGKPSIKLATNSVFTPIALDEMPKVVEEIIGVGVENIYISVDRTKAWKDDEIQSFEKVFKEFIDLSFDNKWVGKIRKFDEWEKNISRAFICGGSHKTLAIDPTGKIWGCYRFWDLFNRKKDFYNIDKYIVGSVSDDKQGIELGKHQCAVAYSFLRTDQNHTTIGFCKDCNMNLQCAICPAEIALFSNIFDRVPTWMCEISKREIALRSYYRDKKSSVC